MRLRRMLAFVLTLAMLMGNVTPAFATETSVTNSISGDVTVTTDENGNTVITSNSGQTPEIAAVNDGEGGAEETDNGASGDVIPGENGTTGTEDGGTDSSTPNTGSDENNTSSENGTEEDSDQTGTDGTENDSSVSGNDGTGEGSNENGTESGSEETGNDTTVSDNDVDLEEEESDETLSDNDITVSENDITLSENSLTVAAGEEIFAVYSTDPNSDYELVETKNFSTIAEVISYINNAEYAYEIKLLKDTTISENWDFSSCNANWITLTLCNSVEDEDVMRTLTVPEGVSVSIIIDTIQKGNINLGAGSSLTLQDRSSSMNVEEVNFNGTSGKLIIGEDENEDSDVYLYNVGTNVKNLDVYGNVYWDGESEVKVTNDLTVRNIQNEETKVYQEAGFGAPVTTLNFYLNHGNVSVKDFKSTGNAQVTAGRRFNVRADGSAEFKNIEVQEEDWNHFQIALDQDIALTSKDSSGNSYADYIDDDWNEIFNGQDVDTTPFFKDAEMQSAMGTLRITGKVTLTGEKQLPVYVQKMYCWNLPGEEHGQRSCNVAFGSGEDFAVVNADVSAVQFTIDSIEGEEACVRKYTVDGEMRLQAAAISVEVMHVEGYIPTEDGEEPQSTTYRYPTLEDAIAGITTDFGSAVGEYHIRFMADERLEKNLTIPACVTDLHLMTNGGGTVEGESFIWMGDYQRELDLNGYSLSTSASVNMGSGLRIVSNAEKDGNTVAGTLNLTKASGEALNIYEGNPLVKDEDGTVTIIADRAPVLRNVTVNAKNGSVCFWGTGWQDMEKTSITAKEVEINRGEWKCDSITAANLRVQTYEEWDETQNPDAPIVFEKASLLADNITISGGRMEVRGTVGSYGWDEGSIHPNLTLNDAKLYIDSREDGECGDCYLNTLTVTKAFAGESMGDYTVENNGQFFMDTLEMKVGTLENRGNMIIDKVNNIKDFHNQGSLICNTFNQLAKSKTYLAGGSRLLINESGTLYNINLGDRHGNDGDPVLGLGGSKEGDTIKTAAVTIKGTFTRNEENQKLGIAVTDSYKEIKSLPEKDMTYFNPYPVENDNYSGAVKLITLTGGAALFATDNKEFPVESIFVLLRCQLDESGNAVTDDEGNPIGNPYRAAIQYIDTANKINEVRVAGENIALYSIPDGNEEEPYYMKSFTSWKDAMNYLNAVGNVNTEYVLSLGDEKVDIGGALKLPSNVASLRICGTREEERQPALTELIFTGNVDLVTDTEFINVELPDTAAVHTKGKKLYLDNVSGKIQTITGTAATIVEMYNCNLELTKAVSGIGTIALINSDLTTAKDVTVTTLILENETNSSSLDAKGKITITDINTVGEGNTLKYSGGLEIKGELYSESYQYENGKIVGIEEDNSNVYDDPIKEVVDTEGKTEITGYTIKKELSSVDEADKLDYKIVKKNAVNLVYTGEGTVTTTTELATTPKIASYWFVYNRTETADEVKIENVTRKEANSIKYGPKAEASGKVVLNVFEGYDTETGEPLLYEVDGYAALQEAFDEIERIGNAEQSYWITLNGDVAMESKGKPADYKFPSKAAGVTIAGVVQSTEEDTLETISFKTKAEIKCHTYFEGVSLKAQDAKGTLNIGNFEAALRDAEISENITVTGGGIGKGSHFIVAGSGNGDAAIVTSVDKVDILSIVASDLYVTQKTNVGKLWMGDGTKLYGVGAIQITDIECNGTGEIVTFPTKVTVTDMPIEEGSEEKEPQITAMTSTLTISGELVVNSEDGGLNIELGKSFENKDGTVTVTYYRELNEEEGEDGVTAYVLDFAESLKASNKAIIAKAPKLTTDNVSLGQDSYGLYKKSGNIVYKDSEPAVRLSYDGNSYEEDGTPIKVVTECESFADAVAEINSLKTKRDYEICFLEVDSDFVPTALTMPNKNYVDTLTLTSIRDASGNNSVYYLKDLTFTSNVILKDISFVQMVQVKEDGETYYEAADVAQHYPAPVNVKAGNNNLIISGEVTFNTPILLNGGGKGTLNVEEGAAITACPEADTDGLYIQGKVTGFANVSLDHEFTLDGWYITKGENDEYNACELNVTKLELGESASVTVGNGDEDAPYKNNVKVTDLVMNGSIFTVYGNGEFKNVTLTGDNPVLEVYGQKFNITGLLTSTAADPELVTVINDKLESVLNISGTAVLEGSEENRIMVTVADETGDSVILGSGYDDDKTYSNHLLAAQKVNENVFLVHPDCTEVGASDEYNFTESPDTPGYFLKKNGKYIEIHYSDEIEAALCTSEMVTTGEGDKKVTKKEYDVINYYGTIDEAIATIKSFKDVTAEYDIVLLKSVGSQDAPRKIAIPEQAAKVTFTAADPEYVLYNSNNIAQKTDIAFENIKVENIGTWDAKKFGLEINNAEVTVKGKTTVVDLILVDGGVLETGNTTTITNIKNSSTSAATQNNCIISKPGTLTIKGYVEGVHQMILKAVGVKALESTGNKYTLSNDAKFVVLEKETTMDKFIFMDGNDNFMDTRAVWASKGIYLVPIGYTNSVEVVKYLKVTNEESTDESAGSSAEGSTGSEAGAVSFPESEIICLDIAEASNYINTISDKNADYLICLGNDISDAKVTDGNAVSALTLPNKDKAGLVILAKDPKLDNSDADNPDADNPDAEDSDAEDSAPGSVDLKFTNDLKVNGMVEIQNVKLDNASFSISCEKNSDVKVGKEVTLGESQLILTNVTASGLKNITGKKGATDVILNDTNLTLSGGITNVVDFELNGGKITTNAKSDIQQLALNEESYWDTRAVTTIGDVYLATGTESYVGTCYPKDKPGIPQLTITGKVNGADGNEKLAVKIYDFKTGKELEAYDNQKLLAAKTESADKFVAYPYKSNGNIAAYKDKSGYVYNGNIDGMKVILSQQAGENEWTDSYVKDWAEAINIINNFGTKTDVYRITLRGDETTVSIGAMALPKAGKAHTLVIAGNGNNSIANAAEHTLEFTGAIQANCNLEFENVNLHEKDSKGKTVNGITVKTGVYNVEFKENVTVVTDEDFANEADIVFKVLDGAKGGAGFTTNSAYAAGEIKLGKLIVSGMADVISEKKITITDIVYADDADKDASGVNITTYYTNKAFAKSSSQLNINGEVEDGIKVNVRPMIYHDDAQVKGYAPITQGEIEMLQITSDVKPSTFQKVITAPKMIASDGIRIMYNENPENSAWTDAGLHTVKQDGGIYFTKEEIGVEVKGFEIEVINEGEKPVEKPVYTGNFFTWEQAVKEIDKLGHSNWVYNIHVLKDQGTGTPLKSITMPSKADEVRVYGVGEGIGILTTGNKLSMKVSTTFNNISLCAVKKTGNSYYSIPLTVDCGKTELKLSELRRGCDYDDMGWHESELKLSGNANGLVEVYMGDEGYCDFITQITNVGHLVLKPATEVQTSGEGEEATTKVVNSYCNYYIKDGIKGVKTLELLAGAEITADKSEVSVTNLLIGQPNEENNNDSNELRSNLQAKNITVTGTTTMASAGLRAGTTAVGDGKITLGNLVFKDCHNNLEAKQAAKGSSLINIKGTVTTEDENPGWSAATITLYLSNSMQNKAQLADGMTLLTAPKAVSSLFRPDYAGVDDKGTPDDESDDEYYQNMGPEIADYIAVPEYDDNGDPVIDEGTGEQAMTFERIPLYGLYKSGNDIKYSRLKDVEDNEVIERNEVRLYVGSSNLDSVDWNVPSIDFATFEEAVKAIDSLALYKEGTKEFEEYTIELLKNVNIGNDKGDGKFSALTLPSKASQVTIRGPEKIIRFSGNVTLKCNTTLESVLLLPMKAVKGGAEPATANLVIGNFTLIDRYSGIGYWGEDGSFVNCLNNVTGSAKGRLIISEVSVFEANSISGIAVEFAGNGSEIQRDEGGFPHMGELIVYGNLTTKELKYADYAASCLTVYGKLTVDAIYVEGETFPVIQVEEGNPIQIKGTTRTLEDKTKVTGSVFFDEVVKYENGGIQPETEVTDNIVLGIWSATGPYVPDGIKVITGKYLNPDDWRVEYFWEDGNIERTCYQNGNDLYLGSVVQEVTETPSNSEPAENPETT